MVSRYSEFVNYKDNRLAAVKEWIEDKNQVGY